MRRVAKEFEHPVSIQSLIVGHVSSRLTFSSPISIVRYEILASTNLPISLLLIQIRNMLSVLVHRSPLGLYFLFFLLDFSFLPFRLRDESLLISILASPFPLTEAVNDGHPSLIQHPDLDRGFSCATTPHLPLSRQPFTVSQAFRFVERGTWRVLE